jgi:hypothetical protein
VQRRQREEPRRELLFRAAAQRALGLRIQRLGPWSAALPRHALQLLIDPGALAIGERLRFALRSPARDGDPNHAVLAHANEIAPRPRVPHEHHIRRRVEWKRGLHHAC